MGIKDYIKKQYETQKKEWAEQKAFDVKLKEAKQKAYREELLKAKVKASQEVARVETAVKLKKWKARMEYVPSRAPPIFQPTPSVRKIVTKIKGKKGRKAKRKKFIKKVIRTKAPVAPRVSDDHSYFSDITRGLPS